MNAHRRTLGIVALAITLLAGCATTVSGSHQDRPPIVFVHGNGDSAALWQATLWRFESNGWPTERLHAIDVPYPLARDADNKAQAGRTSTAEHMAYLRDEVQAVLRRTGASQVVLVGNSRGATRSATSFAMAVVLRSSAMPSWVAPPTTAYRPFPGSMKRTSFREPAPF